MPQQLKVPRDTLALRLRAIRYEEGMTVEEAARRAKIPAASWSYWERGGSPKDYEDITQRIAGALGYDPVWLALGGSYRTHSGVGGTISRSRPRHLAPFIQSPLIATVV